MIRKAILFCCVSLVMTVIPFLSQGPWGCNSVLLTEAVAGSNPLAVLGVDQLIKEVDRHKGLIRVEGIVTAVAPDKQMMALVDVEQFKKCGVLVCPTYLILPVRWVGTMPSLKDAVMIEGQVKERGGKLVFEAQNLDKLAPKLGESK